MEFELVVQVKMSRKQSGMSVWCSLEKSGLGVHKRESLVRMVFEAIGLDLTF